MSTRRNFLKETLAAGTLISSGISTSLTSTFSRVDDEQLKAILKRPVLKKDRIKDPVIIESVDLIKLGSTFVVRARSVDGVEGYAASNWKMITFWPVFVDHVAPFFEGKDARDLEDLIQRCFIARSHYKLQSMAIWVPIASAEFAILDLLGKASRQSVSDLLGERVRDSVDVYWANNFRGRSAEESVRRIAERYEKERPPAIKFKVAGRMGEPEEPPGRSERMIPMLRNALGDDVVIYADANGGYSVKEAIRIGRILEDIGASFFEEPCPFYELWETKEVADALDIPVAAGEQESAMRRFRWMVSNHGADVLQPDLFYYGGLIRSMKVARMAGAAGLMCTPHVSGGDMNMLYIAHYATVVENAGPHQEYKSPGKEIPYEITDGWLEAKNGLIQAPSGPGLGVQFDPDWIQAGRTIGKKELL